jgi:hypothetical protein
MTMIDVKDYGALGDNAADDTVAIQAAIDAAFGPASAPNGTQFQKNKPLYFPAGHYKTSAPLLITKLQGGKVYGDGRFTTTIRNVTANSTVFKTNGCSYSSFADMNIIGSAGGVLLDLDWDGTSGGAALQSNSFRDIHFQTGAYGLRIGHSGKMGSENTIIGCYFGGQTEAGLVTRNFNALQNTVVGCNFAGCKRGIWVNRGSVPFIAGSGFQVNSEWDIAVDSSANDTMVVSGCRSESINFWRGGGIVRLFMQGVSHLHGTPGYFVETNNSAATVERCTSIAGKIKTYGDGRVTVRGCDFGRLDWLEKHPIRSRFGGTVELEQIQAGATHNGSMPTGQVYDESKMIYISKQRIDWNGTRNYVLEPALGG